VLTAWSRLDWVLLAIMLLSVVFSILKGFTRELISLGAAIWGIILACWFYRLPAAWLAPYVRTPEIASLTGFFAVLLACMIGGGVLSKLAGKVVDKSGLRWFDRLLGAAFGMVRGLLLCLALLLGLAIFPLGGEPMANSRLAPYLVQGARLIVLIAPRDLRARFQDGLHRAQKIWSERSL